MSRWFHILWYYSYVYSYYYSYHYWYYYYVYYYVYSYVYYLVLFFHRFHILWSIKKRLIWGQAYLGQSVYAEG